METGFQLSQIAFRAHIFLAQLLLNVLMDCGIVAAPFYE